MKAATNNFSTLIIIWICFFSNTSIEATIPYLNAKGLYSSLNPLLKNKKGIPIRDIISPINGMNWWETKIIENMYRYGDETTATVLLIKRLFYLQKDSVTFGPTTLPRNIEKYFTASTIGKIMNSLLLAEHYLSQADFAKSMAILEKNITQKILSDINVSQHIKNAQTSMQQKAIEMGKALALYNKTADRKSQLNLPIDITNYAVLKKQQQKIRSDLKRAQEKSKTNLSSSEHLELQRKINEYQKYIRFVAEIHDSTFTQENLNSKAKEFSSLLVRALKESNGSKAIYPPYCPHALLLAFLWKKAELKEEFLTYFSQFRKDFIAGAKLSGSWLNDRYTFDELRKIFSAIELAPDILIQQIKDDYEGVSLAFLNEAWANPWPKMIDSQMITYTRPDGTKNTFAACGEISLENLFDIILFDKKTNQFNIDLLLMAAEQANKRGTPIEARISKKLIQFFNTYKNALYMDKSTFDDWGAVVSNLSGVGYAGYDPDGTQTHEIRPGLEDTSNSAYYGILNMLKILNNLLFGNNPAFDALSVKNQIDLFVQTIQRDDFDITWNIQDIANKDDLNSLLDKPEIYINFSVPKKSFSFQWGFYNNHFVLYPLNIQQKQQIPIPADILNRIDSLPTMHAIAWLITAEDLAKIPERYQNILLFARIGSDVSEFDKLSTVSVLLKQKKPNKNILNAVLESINNAHDAVINVFKQIKNAQPLMQELYPNLKNEAARTEYIKYLIDQNQHGAVKNLLPTITNENNKIAIMLDLLTVWDTYKEVLSQWITAVPTQERYKVSLAIIENKAAHFYPFVIKWVNTLDPNNQGFLLAEIIKNRVEQLYAIVTEITPQLDPFHIQNITTQLLFHKIISLYPLIDSISPKIMAPVKLTIIRNVVTNDIKELNDWIKTTLTDEYFFKEVIGKDFESFFVQIQQINALIKEKKNEQLYEVFQQLLIQLQPEWQKYIAFLEKETKNKLELPLSDLKTPRDYIDHIIEIIGKIGHYKLDALSPLLEKILDRIFQNEDIQTRVQLARAILDNQLEPHYKLVESLIPQLKNPADKKTIKNAIMHSVPKEGHLQKIVPELSEPPQSQSQSLKEFPKSGYEIDLSGYPSEDEFEGYPSSQEE